MKLFNETENKYYELLSYLVNGKGEYSDKEIIAYLNDNLGKSHDYDIEDFLFDQNPESATVLTYEDGAYVPVLADPLPIRNNRTDLQAIKSLRKMPHVKMFLSEHTLEKLEKIGKGISTEWDVDDIAIKNQFQNKIYENAAEYIQTLKVVLQAIQENRGILYDNILPGKYAYHDAMSFS